jgi:hypothetical protein
MQYHTLNPAPNSALAIFQRPESAAALIKASPVTITLEIQSTSCRDEDMSKGQDEFPEDVAQNVPSRTDATELHAPNSLLESTSYASLQKNVGTKALQQQNETTPSFKDIRFFAEYWRGNQQDFLERSPTWGPFAVNKNSATQQDLAKRVPLVGMSDINVHKREVPLRILRKKQEELRAKKSWMQIWEEGRAEQGKNVGIGMAKEESV